MPHTRVKVDNTAKDFTVFKNRSRLSCIASMVLCCLNMMDRGSKTCTTTKRRGRVAVGLIWLFNYRELNWKIFIPRIVCALVLGSIK